MPLSLVERGQPHQLALLVDRDADTRRMYSEYLRPAAIDIAEAEDGREALAKAISAHPDIVVTETRLPGLNGFDLCTLLRTDSETKDAAIVFVTGDGFEGEHVRAHRCGADSVLVKPCLPETLSMEVRRLLAQSSALRERARMLHERVREQLARADQAMQRSRAVGERRVALSRSHHRGDTTSPPAAPPTLVCPTCDQPLRYERSHIGGVSARHAEQWDYFACPRCTATYQYRQRTRKLRQV